MMGKIHKLLVKYLYRIGPRLNTYTNGSVKTLLKLELGGRILKIDSPKLNAINKLVSMEEKK